jgi:predicted transglutaminase-like cysteine proteinase
MALFAAALSLAGCNQTLETGKMMSTQGYAFAPPAFYAFCSKEPRLCNTAGGTKLVKLSTGSQDEFSRVKC